LQDEAKTFFEALKKEKHDFEYEERVLKDFINKLTILMGQLALQFKAVAGFVKDRPPQHTLHIYQYDQIERLTRELFNMVSEIHSKGVGAVGARFSTSDTNSLLNVANIISNIQRDDSYDSNKNPQSNLASLIAKALNDIMWVALQLKELKKLYSREEKWRVAEDDIVKNCMSMLSRIGVDKDVDVLVHLGSISEAKHSLAGDEHYRYFGIRRVDHDVQQLLGHVNMAEREEEATQNMSKQFHSLISKIEDIIKLIYQRFTRIYRYTQTLTYFLTNLRRVQTVNIDSLKLVELLQSIYSHNRTLDSDIRLRLNITMDLSRAPHFIDSYNKEVVEFKASVERKLNLMSVIDRKMREGFAELNAMINANKAISVLSSEETDLLHRLIGDTKSLEAQSRRARRKARKEEKDK